MKNVLLMSLAATLALSGKVCGETTFFEHSVETSSVRIDLDPVNDDVRFAITLRDKSSGFVRSHEFEGEAANDPSPFQISGMQYCGTWVILVTISFPLRHAPPRYRQILDTYAFRSSDFEFIDMAYGPLTDIALMDVGSEGGMDVELQPPIGVRCLSDPAGPPFEFFQYRTG